MMRIGKYFWYEAHWQNGFAYDSAKECYNAAKAEHRALTAEGLPLYEITIYMGGQIAKMLGVDSDLNDILSYEVNSRLISYGLAFIIKDALCITFEDVYYSVVEADSWVCNLHPVHKEELFKLLFKYYGKNRQLEMAVKYDYKF